VELGKVEDAEVLFALDAGESLMGEIFLTHDEELKVGTEEQELETLWVLVAEVLDQTMQYVDYHHVPDCPIVQNIKVVVVSCNYSLDFFR